MKKIAVLMMVFLIGVLGTLWLKKDNHTTVTENQLIYNGIEQISKLQVTEGYFTEVHSYKDSKSYWNDLVSFDKKALVVVNAKAIISYDVSKINIQADSINKSIIVNKLPAPEITIVPDINYYDIQQSSFNSFNASDFNKIKGDVMKELKQNPIVDDLKKQAHDRLFEELSKLLLLSKQYQWKVIDNTNTLNTLLKG